MALIEVVKYEGSPDVYAWKYPNSELGTWTQLIVNQSQEAILFKGGRAMDAFGPGRHTLSTANIPVLNHIINLPFGGDSPFSAEVWYVNKMVSLDVKWGTVSPIKLQDPKYNIIVPVRAFGQFGVTVEDSRKFLTKLVGTMHAFDQATLSKYLRGIMMMNFNETVSSYLINKKISILEINAYISEISEHVGSKVKALLEQYGVRMLNFYVDSISVPEDDESLKRLRDALARKAEMDIVGYSYQQERTFDTLEGAAKNEGSSQSNLMGAGIGLGMGFGLGGAFGGQMGGLTSQLNMNASALVCAACQAVNAANAAFCSSCGTGLGQQAKPTVAPRSHSCDKCGQALHSSSKFCAHCGDEYNACPKCGADCSKESSSCGECGEPLPRPCKGCGEQIDGNVKFCPHCGEGTAMKCPNCSYEVKANQKFCMECGHGLG